MTIIHVGGESEVQITSTVYVAKISNSNCVELNFTVTIRKISTRETSFDVLCICI